MAENSTSKEAIARRLRLAREQAGLSQGQVAKMLEMHRPAISEMEAGRRRVSAEELGQLVCIYDVSVQWVLGTAESTPERDSIELAARELTKLSPTDLQTMLRLLQTLGRVSDADSVD